MSRVSIDLKDFKRIFLLALVVGFSFIGSLKAIASDNVLQAIQVEGVKDSYDIILKSDDVAELKKTIQSPNKMILTLKGIRASKSINTIYNNTSTVDSVVVEPTGEDSVKILIQANNVNNAEVKFDTLKTPLGVLDNVKSTKSDKEIVLSGPMKSYQPVYEDTALEEESTGLTLSGIMSSTGGQLIKRILKSDKLSWLIALGLFMIVILNAMKSIKGKDSELQVGLSQSLRERELELCRNMHQQLPVPNAMNQMNIQQPIASAVAPQSTSPITGINYGLKAYQNGTKSPYMSADAQRPRQTVAAPSKTTYENLSAPKAQNLKTTTQTVQRPSLNTVPNPAKGKTSNIDSMKFLESMTRIYEKNGRSDLAQGIKTNMKKAKANIA